MLSRQDRVASSLDIFANPGVDTKPKVVNTATSRRKRVHTEYHCNYEVTRLS